MLYDQSSEARDVWTVVESKCLDVYVESVQMHFDLLIDVLLALCRDQNDVGGRGVLKLFLRALALTCKVFTCATVHHRPATGNHGGSLVSWLV